MSSTEDRYVFWTEWYDSQADVIRRYMLTYFPRDHTVEMYCPKNKRPFLKRSEYAEVTLADLYIGSVVTILARQLKVVEYADAHTRKMLEEQKGRTLALIKPDGYNHIGTVLTAVYASNFTIARLKMVRMTPAQAQAWADLLPPGEAPPGTAEHLCSDVVVAMELVGDEACSQWRMVMGPQDPQEAARTAPKSLRAYFGTDEVRNFVHGSAGPERAAAEIAFFFDDNKAWPTTALFNNCTLCIVRPHALRSSGGEIVGRILAEGFEISAMRMWHMDKATSEEFLEVYKGVLPEYHDLCSQFCTGPSLVMEVRQEEATKSFRKLVGPHDPEVAKHLRPDTIRAKYGVDRVRNAVHCTDLPEDGLLECEYFFNILYDREK